MSISAPLVVAGLATWMHAIAQGGSPADPSCNTSEVARLLWTAIGVATAAGTVAILRPTWRRVAALVASALTWAWIDMEGPVLASRGTHGIHLADVPVIVALAAAGAAGLRLILRRGNGGMS